MPVGVKNTQALAAVLGGTQSLHCNGRDEALALPTEESATIALRTQQILLHESGVAATADPVGGAYAIEERTTGIEREAQALLDQIDDMGGTLTAIETGFIQRQIQDAAYEAQRAIDAGRAVVVGVNQFADASASRVAVFRVDPEMERRQIDRLRALRAGRSEHAWSEAVSAVDRAARDGAQIICTQELFRSQYFCQNEDHTWFDLAEPIPGPTTEVLGGLAAELGVVIVASLFERRAPGLYHNTAVVFERDGRMVGKYRKMHIPDDPGYYEKFYFTPGDTGFRAFDTKFGRIAALVCWP